LGSESELTLTCRQCGKQFIFTESEQQFYQQKGFTTPNHCRDCRSARRTQTAPVCSKCGKMINNIGDVLCVSCLETIRLGLDLETRKLREGLDEVNAKLAAHESEKTRLIDSLNANLAAMESEKVRFLNDSESKLMALESEKAGLVQETERNLGLAETEKQRLVLLLEQETKLTADLQERLNQAGIDLEKACKFRASLDYLDPALNNIGKRLEALERNQEHIKQALLLFTQNLDQVTQNRFEFFKRFFRINRKSISTVN
jgi:hypothetical protein